MLIYLNIVSNGLILLNKNEFSFFFKKIKFKAYHRINIIKNLDVDHIKIHYQI